MRAEVLLMIVAMGAVTYLSRLGGFLLVRAFGVPRVVARWLTYVPVGILTALVVPTLLVREGRLHIGLDNHYLLAGIVAAVIAYRTRNVLLTVGVGLAAVFALQFLGSGV
ncbi:MAG: AzlD domain-containing protein [Spirochaetaceae bacterium]|nr:MAG: AzlD domain-containing protein [Spirochaetaceae bacterium]